MSAYPIWFYFAASAMFWLFAAAPMFKWADSPPIQTPARQQALDGLRGFLALSVFFHHASIYHLYFLTGRWTRPPSNFFNDLGQGGVALFFMITGYLFWGQCIAAKGRLPLVKFYIGRFFRIIPLYTVLVLVVLVTVGFMTGWRLREPAPVLLEQVGRWLAGGFWRGGIVNGYADTSVISAGVTWTLHYEWLFYFSLILTSLLTRQRLLALLAPLAGVVVFGVLSMHARRRSVEIYPMLFSLGMLAAAAKARWGDKSGGLQDWLKSLILIACVAGAFQFSAIYRTAPTLLLGCAFFMIVFETSLFGLLLTRPAKRLGNISYGLYLLQGPVLFFCFRIPGLRALAIGSSLAHWTIALIAGGVLVAVATAAHQFIEKPGIALGKRVAGLAAKRLKPQPQPHRPPQPARA